MPLGSQGLLGSKVFEDSSSESCRSRCSARLQTCLKTHDICSRTKENQLQLPTRVIDVGSAESPSHPFLHITKHGEVGSWAALSYCWGGLSTLTLTKNNLAELTQNIALRYFQPLFGMLFRSHGHSV